MSWTKRQLISEAFSELGLQGYEFDISPAEQTTALRRLDTMMALWSGKGICVDYALPATPGASDPDDESGLPDDAVEAVYLNLAVRLAPGYGKQVSPVSKKSAREGYDLLERDAAKCHVRQQRLRGGFPIGAGNKYWGFNYLTFFPAQRDCAPSTPCVPGDSACTPCPPKYPCPPQECEVVVQPTRTGDFTLQRTDSNTVIPVLGDCVVIIDTATNLTAPVRIVRYDAGSLRIQSLGGVSVVDPSTGLPWTFLQVDNHLSSILIDLGGTSDEYIGLRIGE